MLKIKLICVGNLKETYLKLGVEEYLKRLSRFAQFSLVEIEESPLKKDNLEGVKAVLQIEANSILKAIPPSAYVVLLDIRGELFTSEKLAIKIEAIHTKSSQLVLIIGGSHGVSDNVRLRANEKWSFSSLTFPHQLFRLMLVEQLYRSFMLMHGQPYHK